jgi:ABC-2 type transport system ATP-binding protein
LPEVQAVCDRVQILNRGKTVFNDTLEGVASLEKVFFDLIFREAEITEEAA